MEMQLEEVYKHIMDGEAVLFIGAGFSREAVNVKDQKMKDAVQLSEDLCNEMGIDLSKNLGEYSCAMKSHFRKSGNQMSGKWKSSYASLLA